MSNKDFDPQQLAAYLHIPTEEVVKLASRGKLPGRRVNGQWRFSESAIHHWLEEQIGTSNAEQLGKVEELLRRANNGESQWLQLSDIMHVDSTSIPLDARTRGSIIREMCQLAAKTGLLWDADKMALAVQDREDLHPTALENGVALLHPRRPQQSILAEPILALGITSSPIPFGNTAGFPTDVFFLICSTDERVHLQILTRLSRLLSDSSWLSQLRNASSASEAIELVRVAENDCIPTNA
jgi:nitrogen PTS system EIIA component